MELCTTASICLRVSVATYQTECTSFVLFAVLITNCCLHILIMSVKHYVHASEQPKGKEQRREFANCFIYELKSMSEWLLEEALA